MPKGQKNVDWTNPGNDQKLLLAIIKVTEIGKNYDGIAAAFGGVPASSIALRIKKLRSKAKAGDMGFAEAKSKKTNMMTGLKTTSTPKKAIHEDSESNDEFSDDGRAQAATPPKTPNAHDKVVSGRIAKRVSSLRKTPTKNYKKMVDPFMDMEAAKDEDGKNVFGMPEKSEDENEDSDPSDSDFGKEKTGIKAEAGYEPS